jgi:hypothetical protein
MLSSVRGVDSLLILFDECNAEQLSDEQLDRVSGGSLSECKQCHEDDR